jgi:hypothetical protein
MVDAKGKIVGRISWNGDSGTNTVVRQINGSWVMLGVLDLGTLFQPITPNAVTYFYQTVDCTGQAFFPQQIALRPLPV